MLIDLLNLRNIRSKFLRRSQKDNYISYYSCCFILSLIVSLGHNRLSEIELLQSDIERANQVINILIIIRQLLSAFQNDGSVMECNVKAGNVIPYFLSYVCGI